ncbi:MAG TPA: tellurite resistance TerB family protein [Dongiaceae bacterium]|jgi:tellurite resistance protein|nr:tellurite resistance TerB family protein [Dongiaceae bacterium]
MTTHHAALIYTMVLMAAADRDMTDAEMASIGDSVAHLPIFRDYDRSKIASTAAGCIDLLNKENGLDRVIRDIKASLPEKLRETAYALACDVAAADGNVTQEEARLLELLRFGLSIGRLPAAAIERGARARHMMV